ncbi:MAG: hypothetical protein JWP37_273 [Mucilaginibacter sp.]|nr:hypothetical protein [Mucilaginibacter sp.]
MIPRFYNDNLPPYPNNPNLQLLFDFIEPFDT